MNFKKFLFKDDDTPKKKLDIPPPPQKKKDWNAIYSKLSKQYQTDGSPETHDKMMEAYNILTGKAQAPTESDSQLEYANEVEDLANKISESMGKQFNELDEHTRATIVGMAEEQIKKQKEDEPKIVPDYERADNLERKEQDHIDRETELKSKIGDLNKFSMELQNKVDNLEKKNKDLASQNAVLIQSTDRTIPNRLPKEQPIIKEKPMIDQSHSQSSQIAYGLLQKNKSRFQKKIPKGFELKNLQIYCLKCKHTIQAHSKNGISNGCKCGCLKSIEDIAKENNTPLISKREFQEIKQETRKPLLSMKNLTRKKIKVDMIKSPRQVPEQKEPIDETIIEQARKLESMQNKRIVQKPTVQDQVDTKKQERKELLEDQKADGCTCGHTTEQHFNKESFCTEDECPCKQYRAYP